MNDIVFDLVIVDDTTVDVLFTSTDAIDIAYHSTSFYDLSAVSVGGIDFDTEVSSIYTGTASGDGWAYAYFHEVLTDGGKIEGSLSVSIP